MSLGFQSNEPIKHALCEELMNLLSSDRERRVSAEERMKQLEITEGYGVFLAEMTMNQSFDIGVRQLASVMLKKYVEEHWNQANGDNIILATDLAKKMIRSILPNGLYDSNSKIRTSVAYTISIIASLDWPHTWTELFDIIVKCLSENENSIHGAMQVLEEFTYDLDSQIKVVGPLIMTEIYRIFEAEQIYNVRTRTCAVKIFKSLFNSINTYVEKKSEQDRLLNPILPSLMEKLINALSNPNPNVSSFALKTEVIKVLQYMVNEMPRYIRPFSNQILPAIWQLLTQTADVYVKVVVNGQAAFIQKHNNTNNDIDVIGNHVDIDKNNEDKIDEEEELSNFITMILQLIEFIQSIVEQARFKSAIKNVLTDLIYIMIVYMQITEEQIQLWSDDPDKFVEDEYQPEIDDSIRICSHEVLENLQLIFGERILGALTDALARHVNVAEAEKMAGTTNWWKIHEASMVAVGYYRDFILKKRDKFDIGQYLNYVRNTMVEQLHQQQQQQQQIASSYLMARCIWLLSRFSNCGNIYNTQALDEILETILNCLQSDKPLNLRIYGVRSIYEVCFSLKDVKNEKHALVVSKLGSFLDGILALIPGARNSVLSVLLEVITLMTSFDVNFAAAYSNKIIPLTIAVFLKHKDDPFLLEHVQDLLKILSQNRYCLEPLQVKIIPTLVSILNSQNSLSMNTMQDIALDVLQTLVKHSNAPLSEQLIENAFPAAVHCILHTDDNSVMQSGGECLREFINVSPEQVCSYKNGEGLNYIMEITAMLLNPMNAEFSASFAGRLVITIIRKAGNILGENIYLLLKAVISKMQLVESLNVAMSLLITFAHLFATQMEAVLSFLSTVPGPTGEPAIQYVLNNWLNRQTFFYGSYERKISLMAMCKLLEYGVTTHDNRLTSVCIEHIPEFNTRMKRRQQQNQTIATNQLQTTAEAEAATATATATATTTTLQLNGAKIPVLVKIFKLLIDELGYFKESINVNTDDESTVNSGDDDDDNDDNNVNDDELNEEVVKLSSYIFDDEDTDDDNQLMEELQQDPFFQGNMEENLTKFLQHFSQAEHFHEFTGHLTDLEKLVLRDIQVSI